MIAAEMEKENLRIEFNRGYPCFPGIFPRLLFMIVWMYLSTFVCIFLRRWIEIGEWFETVVLLIPIVLSVCNALLSYSCTVCLETDRICVTRFGRTIWCLPIEEIGLVCAVGDYRSQDLCISACTLEEIAALREETLKKNPFNRDGIAFEKTVSQWQTRFAKEYLNRLRRKMYRFREDKRFLFLPMDSVTEALMHRMYPRVSHVNMIAKERVINYSQNTEGVPLFSVTATNDFSAIAQVDDIHVLKKGEQYWILLAEEIQTIACVDRYRDNPKGEDTHSPLLAISTMSIEEMALHDKTNLIVEGGKLTDFPWGKELLATQYCLCMASGWRGHGNELCVMYRTKERIEKLKKLYPNAQWLDVSCRCN